MNNEPEDQAEQAAETGIVEEVTDEGFVRIEYPSGRSDTVRIPLEQVPSYRMLLGRDWRRGSRRVGGQ